MSKILTVFGAAAMATVLSGCALVTSNTQRSGDNTGYNTTFGLIGFTGMGNDYPLIPLYMHYSPDGAHKCPVPPAPAKK